MKTSVKRYAAGLLLFLAVMCTAVLGVSADDCPIKGISLDKSVLNAGDNVTVTILFDESVEFIDISVKFSIEGTSNAKYFSAKGDDIRNHQISITLESDKLVAGTYSLEEVKYKVFDDPDNEEKYSEYPIGSDPISYEVKGGADFPVFMNSSAKFSKTEIKAGERFTFTASFDDVNQINDPILTIRKVDEKKAKEILNYSPTSHLRSGRIQTFTWTIPSDNTAVGSRFHAMQLEAVNSEGRKLDVSLAALAPVSVVEKYTNEGDSSGESGDSGDSESSDKGDSSKESGDEKSSSLPSTSSSSSTTTSKKKTADTMAPVAFDKNWACSGGTDAEQSIAYLTTSVKSDDPFLGTEFYKLRARQAKVTKNSITIKWEAVNTPVRAVKYIVLGAPCGKKKFKELGTTSGRSFTQKKLKKGCYYKYIVMAVDKNERIISTSPSVIIATKGGKFGNYSSVKLSSKKSISMAKGKTAVIKAKAQKSASVKVKPYRRLSYEWIDQDVISVSGNVVRALAKGSSYVYIFSQNGFFKRVKVTVK